MFDIQPSSPTPIYRQVIDQVRRLVAGGQLRSGDELPSVRSVAERHAINPMTVSKAYSLLEAEGLLTRRRGVGMAVAEGARPAVPQTERIALLQTALNAAAQQAVQLDLPREVALQAFDAALRAALHNPDTAP